MSPRFKGSAGSTLVEFALVLPFLALMAFGVVEFGMALQDKTTVQGAARAGVRVGSAAGATADADKNLLLGVGAALQDVGLTNVDWIVVYKSGTVDGAVPAACTNPTHSVSASCNAYTGAQLQQLVAGTAPASWFGCGVTALDRFWCPTSRQTIQSDGTDYLGVSVQARHPMFTGFFGSTLTISDYGVMRLEPQGG
jgi:Flp pilus assembly protein TadG